MAVNTKTLSMDAGQAKAVFRTTLYDGVPDSSYQYASGMTVVGMRYVPKFADPLKWDINNTYEALEIVMWKGNSYTSRQAVPTGIDIMDEDYWVCTGNYNAQVASLQSDVEAMSEIMKRLELAVKTLIEQNENEYKVYECIDSMAEDENLQPGMTAKTLGFNKMGDGGAAVYIIGDGTANGLDVIKCANGCASLVLMTPELLPEQLGAYGNASTDDTDALNRAFEMRVPVCAKQYYVISKDLTVYSPLYGGGEIRGNGYTLTMANSCPEIKEMSFYGVGINIQTGRSENKDIIDCTFDGCSEAIKCYNATVNSVDILRCRFKDQSCSRTSSAAQSAHEIGYVTFQDVVSHGHIRIEDCQMYNTAYAGFALVDTYANDEITVSYNEIQGIGVNSQSSQSASALDMCIAVYIPAGANDMQTGAVSYNTIREVVGTGIYARVTEIVGNVIHNCGYVQNYTSASPAGIKGAAEHIEQNIIDCCGYHGIEILTGIWRCDIVNNTIMGAPERTKITNYQMYALANIGGYVYVTNTGGLTGTDDINNSDGASVISDGSVTWSKVGDETEYGLYFENNRYCYSAGNVIADCYYAYRSLPVFDDNYELMSEGRDGIVSDQCKVKCIAYRAGHMPDKTAIFLEDYKIDKQSRFGSVSNNLLTLSSNEILSADFTKQYQWVLVEVKVNSGNITVEDPESGIVDDAGYVYGIVEGGSRVYLTNGTNCRVERITVHAG